MKINKNKSGFTLIEIAFALLILGVGLLSIVKCFPSGLRQSLEAHNDAVTGLFADNLFSTFHTIAINSAEDPFVDDIDLSNLPEEMDLEDVLGPRSGWPRLGEWSDKIAFPYGSDELEPSSMLDKIKYKLEISARGDRFYEIKLSAKAGESGGRTRDFSTEIFFITPEYDPDS